MRLIVLFVCTVLLCSCGSARRERHYREGAIIRHHMDRHEGRDTNLEIYGDKYLELKGDQLVLNAGNRYLQLGGTNVVMDICDKWFAVKVNKAVQWIRWLSGTAFGTALVTGVLAYLTGKNGRKRKRKKDGDTDK